MVTPTMSRTEQWAVLAGAATVCAPSAMLLDYKMVGGYGAQQDGSALAAKGLAGAGSRDSGQSKNGKDDQSQESYAAEGSVADEKAPQGIGSGEVPSYVSPAATSMPIIIERPKEERNTCPATGKGAGTTPRAKHASRHTQRGEARG